MSSESTIEETHWVTPSIPVPVKSEIRTRMAKMEINSVATMVRYAAK